MIYHKPKKPSEKVLQKLKDYYEYNPETGELFRYYEHATHKTKVGSLRNKYLMVSIISTEPQCYLHHIAWFISYKEWPVQQIDHIDRDKLNNTISNLRLATSLEQSANMNKRKLPSYRINTSKYGRHIKLTKNNTYYVRVNRNGKEISIGTYSTIEEAIIARDKFLNAE